MKSIGLFFGSFNPIHIGHLILANYIVEQSYLEKIWFVVSPQNPFKNKANLLDEYNRLEMVNLATEKYPKLSVTDIEFSLPRPSYTIDTLAYLHEKFPDTEFTLIMGEDIVKTLPKWKNADLLLEHHKIIVYPRISNGEKTQSREALHKNIEFIAAPIIELSSTKIRQMLKAGNNVRPMLPPEVFEYLDGSNFYK